MKVAVYNKEGNEIEKIEITSYFVDLKRNDELVHQVFESLLSNKRQVVAHTKTRGERAGSGAKPWKQKGTGRARVGSVRTPIWKKGGVAFGPRSDRNYKKKVNKKMNAKAISIVLSQRLKEEKVYVLDNFNFSKKKTKLVSQVINILKIKGKTLMLFSKEDKDFRTASRNLKNIKNNLTDQLNVMDMLNTRNILMSKDSLTFLFKKYSK
jgi:large subunit ribosomal protein L4